MSVMTSKGATRRCRSVTGRTAPPPGSLRAASSFGSSRSEAGSLRALPDCTSSTVAERSASGSRTWPAGVSSAHSSPTCRSSSASEPELSTTMSAMASRCSRLAWAAIRAPACSRVMPRCRISRSALDPRRHVHHHDQVEGAGQAVLGDQRHVVRPRSRPGRRACSSSRHPRADQRVHDRVQLGRAVRVGEHDLAERAPGPGVPSGRSTPAPNAPTTSARPGRARLDHLPGDPVGVDERAAP